MNQAYYTAGMDLLANQLVYSNDGKIFHDDAMSCLSQTVMTTNAKKGDILLSHTNGKYTGLRVAKKDERFAEIDTSEHDSDMWNKQLDLNSSFLGMFADLYKQLKKVEDEQAKENVVEIKIGMLIKFNNKIYRVGESLKSKSYHMIEVHPRQLGLIGNEVGL